MAAALHVRDEGSTRVLVLSHPARKNAVDAGVLAAVQGAAA